MWVDEASHRGACMGGPSPHHLGRYIGTELLWKVCLVKSLVCRTKNLSFLTIFPKIYGLHME